MLLLLLALDFYLFETSPCPCSFPTKLPVLKWPGNRPHTPGAFSLTTVAVVGPTDVSVGPNAVAFVQSPVVVAVTVAVGPGVAAVPAVSAVAEAGENVESEFESHAVVHQLADSAAIAGPYPLENLASHTLGLWN